jgi:hypothetical protein
MSGAGAELGAYGIELCDVTGETVARMSSIQPQAAVLEIGGIDSRFRIVAKSLDNEASLGIECRSFSERLVWTPALELKTKSSGYGTIWIRNGTNEGIRIGE